MEYDEKIIREAKRQAAILGIEHLGRVDARTLTIFQKHGIFESMDTTIDCEDILPILNDPEHPDRRTIGDGPLFCYLAKKNPPEANIVNMLDLLFAQNITSRKAAFDYLNNLKGHDFPILTTKSTNSLKTLGQLLLSDNDQQWRNAAVAIHDALDDDWYCNLAALKQCLSRNFIPGIENFLTKVIRPTVSSVETITTGVWAASEQKEEISTSINQISEESNEAVEALNKYFVLFGHLPLINELSITELLDQWQQKHNYIDDIWSLLWEWANSFEWPLQRYHVCMYFASHPERIPSEKHSDFWHEITQISYMSNDEKDDLKWTQSWRMLCEVARHFCCHLENQLPYMEGERIASQAWWFAYHVCALFPSNKEAVKQLRDETFTPELTFSTRVHQVASPTIKPASLRYITLNTDSGFSLGIQSVIGRCLEDLKPESINKDDFQKINTVINGSILVVYPAKFKEDSEKIYAFDEPVLLTAKKWVNYIDDTEKEKEMLSAFVAGIEKIMTADSISDLLNKFIDTHSGDQVIIANYLRTIIYTEEVPLDEIWDVLNNQSWRKVAFGKTHPLVFELIYESLNEIEARYQDKWSYNLPHFYALECENMEGDRNLEHLFACVIFSSICGGTVSGIQRILKGDKRHEYQKEVDYWRKRLGQLYEWSPEWVKSRIRPVLAVLYL